MSARWIIAIALALAVLWTGGSGAVHAAARDGEIRAAERDLTRYEAEVGRLRPTSGSSAKRLRDLLRRTAQRLERSDNKDHESWIAAARRFNALQVKIAAVIDDGKPPPLIALATPAPPKPDVATRQAAPATSKPPPAVAPKPAAGTAETDARIAALQKQLEALAKQGAAGGPDTGLPLIAIDKPGTVPVGETVQLTGLVADEGSPPRLKVDGKPATLFRPAAGTEPLARHTLAFRVDITGAAEGERRVVLEVCDAAGNCVGDEVVLRIGGTNRPAIEGRNFALVIGNNAYADMPELKTAVNDAEALAATLIERYDFQPEHVRLLRDADRNTILGAIESLRDELDTEDRLVIYYAGHGQIDKATGEGFWLPVDAAADKTFTWIANDDIRRQLRGLPAKHVLVIADSCFSGSLTRSAPAKTDIPEDRFFSEIDAHWSRKVISSGGTEPVADSGSGGHSVFAYYLLKTLRANDAPYITSSELFGRFVRAVTNNSSQKPQFGTIANAGDEGFGDFTFILGQDG